MTADAVVFDLDGVITDTASVHKAAWKSLFDAFLEERAERVGDPFRPFRDEDYLTYVDGKAREDGVASFLASRGIDLPRGSPGDPPEAETVFGLGHRKDVSFRRRLAEDGVQAFPSSIALVEHLRERGTPTAIVSASRNCVPVLERAGALGLFDAKVDGVDAAELDLPGKPDPSIFLEAARRLGVQPEGTAVVEDAIAGVAAGRQGRFGLVIGVDRSGDPEALREAGADLVVGDLAELDLRGRGARS